MGLQDNQPIYTVVAKAGETTGNGYDVWTADTLRDMAQKDKRLTFNEDTGELIAIVVFRKGDAKSTAAKEG